MIKNPTEYIISKNKRGGRILQQDTEDGLLNLSCKDDFKKSFLLKGIKRKKTHLPNK